jgi:cobalt/nickel transport protein
MNTHVKTLFLILVCLAVLIPFASSNPDGLEKVAETLGVEETETSSISLMPDYSVPMVENDYSSTLVAGVIGVFLVLGVALTLGKLIAKPVTQKL